MSAPEEKGHLKIKGNITQRKILPFVIEYTFTETQKRTDGEMAPSSKLNRKNEIIKLYPGQN